MSTVTPPPPPPPPVPQTGPQLTAVVSNPPPGLSSVAAGARLDAIIVATMPDGRVEVDSRLGRFLLLPNSALPKDGPIQLQVQTLARHLSVIITSIHGKPPQAALRSLGLTAGAVAQTGGAQTAAPTAPLSGPAAAAASAPGRITAPAAGTVQLTTGAMVTATLMQPTLISRGSGVPTAPVPGAPQGATASPAATANPASAAPGSAAPPALNAQSAAAYGRASGAPPVPAGSVSIPAGNAFTVRIAGIQPPPADGSPPTPPAPSNQPLGPNQLIAGLVTGRTGAAQTVVQTHAGTISISAPSPLPPGTSIQLEIISLPRPETTGVDGSVGNRLTQAMLEARQWPALEEAVNSLRETHPAAAQQLMNGVLPRPDGALAANLMMFLFGIRAGEVRAWLGDAPFRALQRSKPDILSRIRDDFANMGRMRDEPVSGDWRAVPIPLSNQAAIEQIQLYLQRRPDNAEDDDPRKGPGTRFVVDLNLSKMGRLQLDGFVQDETKRFDLIVRTDDRLSDQVQNDIRAIFTDVNEATGISGGLVFQASPANFVEVAENRNAGGIGLVV